MTTVDDQDETHLMKVETSRRPDRWVIALDGEFDLSTAETFEAAMAEAEQSTVERIVVDLSELTFMDSTGLRLLLEAHARSQAGTDRLRLVRGPRRVQRVFELTNTVGLLPFLD